MPLLAPFSLSVGLVRSAEAETSINVSVEGNINVVLSYQDFKLYMAITNTWFAAMREIHVPGSKIGLIDASQRVVMNAASPLPKKRPLNEKKIAASKNIENTVKETLLLFTQTIDLTVINDCYGTGDDKVCLFADFVY